MNLIIENIDMIILFIKITPNIPYNFDMNLLTLNYYNIDSVIDKVSDEFLYE